MDEKLKCISRRPRYRVRNFPTLTYVVVAGSIQANAKHYFFFACPPYWPVSSIAKPTNCS